MLFADLFISVFLWVDFYLSCWHFSLLIKWAWVLSCVHNSQCSQSLMFFWRYRKVRSWFCRTSVRWRITTLVFLSKILIWTQNVFRVGGEKGVAAFGCWCLHSTGGCAWLLFLLCLKVLTPTIRHNIPQAGDCSHDDIQRWYLEINGSLQLIVTLSIKHWESLSLN